MEEIELRQDKTALCLTLYGLFTLAIFLQFSIWMAVLSTLLVVVALVIAYIQRPRSSGTVYESHFHWIIRTFWIGGSVYLPVLTVAAAIVFYYIALPTLQTAIDQGQTDPAALQKIVMDEKGRTLLTTGFFLLLPFAAWWLYRCGKGIKLALQKRPVENVNSWF